MNSIKETSKFGRWWVKNIPRVDCHIVWEVVRRRALIEADVESVELGVRRECLREVYKPKPATCNNNTESQYEIPCRGENFEDSSA